MLQKPPILALDWVCDEQHDIFLGFKHAFIEIFTDYFLSVLQCGDFFGLPVERKLTKDGRLDEINQLVWVCQRVSIGGLIHARHEKAFRGIDQLLSIFLVPLLVVIALGVGEFHLVINRLPKVLISRKTLNFFHIDKT